MKAKFQMSMVRDDDHISLFNTEKIGQEVFADNTALTVDKFAQSVKMSTYLVAFIVCDFDSLTGQTEDGKNVSETFCFSLCLLCSTGNFVTAPIRRSTPWAFIMKIFPIHYHYVDCNFVPMLILEPIKMSRTLLRKFPVAYEVHNQCSI